MSNLTGFEQFWFFFMFGKKCFTYPVYFNFLELGGSKIQTLFPTNFLGIPCNFEQLWFFSCLAKQISYPIYFFGGGLKIQKTFLTNFLAISPNFERLWFFSFDNKKIVRLANFFGGVAKKFKNHFRPIFSPFQAILNNFDFFHFWQKKFVRPANVLGGWLKSSKIIFNQFSRHFR